VTEFLTLENVQPQQIYKYKQMTVVYGEDVSSYLVVTHCLLSFVEAEEAFKMIPGRDANAKLSVKKTVVQLKILYCRIVESMCS